MTAALQQPLSPDSPRPDSSLNYEVAATLHNLAAALAARGQVEEGENHYRRALAIKEKLLGADNPDVALTRNNLGKLLADMERPAEALPLIEAAVAVLESRLPPGHPHLSAARGNLRNTRRSLEPIRASR